MGKPAVWRYAQTSLSCAQLTLTLLWHLQASVGAMKIWTTDEIAEAAVDACSEDDRETPDDLKPTTVNVSVKPLSEPAYGPECTAYYRRIHR